MDDLGEDVVYIVRPAERDWRGDPKAGAAEPVAVEGCNVQPASSTEATDQRDTVTTTLRLFAPGGTDLRATDQVRWNDQLYEVVGEPDAWAPGGDSHHVQAELRRVRG